MMGRRLLITLIPAAVLVVSLGVATPLSAATGHYRYFHGDALNDPHVTPGARFAVSAATICRSGYASSVRSVSESRKAQVYAEYAITHRTSGQYEIDHLISLELGGSNAVTNLWPEPNDHPHGYLNSKDILENRLHALVCAGRVALARAQALIATNWVSAYHEFLGTWPGGVGLPTTTNATSTSSVSPPGAATVTITSVTSRVAPGRDAVLIARASAPNVTCVLSVTLPSGRRSTESGLGAATSDARGVLRWHWRIGPTTGAGTASASVSCARGIARASFVIS
jgi:hypothetical protein